MIGVSAMASLPQTAITAAEFEAMLERAGEQGRLIELIDGEVIEKVVTELHGIIVLLLGYHLLKYREDKPDIRVSTEVHHRAPDGGPNVYQPDIAVTLLTNALPVQDRGAVPRMPDLAIEVWSPTNSLVSLRKKAEYYLAHGTQMVWIVNPKKRLIDVYRAGADVEILTDTDTLDGGDLLPGFSLSVAALFDSVR
ncbi:MAG: hypothetical protein B6D42_08850 [Anaerolineae bacterium UTCFX5]|nr:MAG: hypothetical protein B6D42_08850 [Anaerolineae bacterium UTCFX5]